MAEYPFTTLAPVLGTVEAGDGRQLTVADVPGLVEGASEGIGLGHEFLAHLERARLFLHVIDVTEDVAEQFHAIDRELAAYGAGLAGRPQIVVLNKIDLLPEALGFPVSDPRVVEVVAGLGGDGRRDRRAAPRAVRARSGRGARARAARSRRTTSSPTSSSTARSRRAGGRTGSSAPTAAIA